MNKINRKSLCKFPFNFASFPWSSSCSVATRRSTATTAMVNLNQTLVGGQLFPMQATKIDSGIKYRKKDSVNWLLPYSSGHSLSPLSSMNLNRCGMVYQYLNDAQKRAQITSVINGMKTNGQCWSKWKRASMVSLYSVQSGADPSDNNDPNPEEENKNDDTDVDITGISEGGVDVSDDANNYGVDRGKDDIGGNDGRGGNDVLGGKRSREIDGDEDDVISSKVQRSDVGPSTEDNNTEGPSADYSDSDTDSDSDSGDDSDDDPSRGSSEIETTGLFD